MHFKKLVLAAVLCATSVAHAEASDSLGFPKEFEQMADHEVALVCLTLMVKAADAAYRQFPVETRERWAGDYLVRAKTWSLRAQELGATEAEQDHWFRFVHTSRTISVAQIVYCRNAGQLRFDLLTPLDKEIARASAKNMLNTLISPE